MARKILVGAAIAFVVSVIAYQWRYDSLPEGAVADRVVVEKGARTLTIYRDETPLKTYKVALGRSPSGPKEFEGDGRTPEGEFVIDTRKADSSFHRALHLSYPLPEHVAYAKSQGRSAGGLIMVHGIRNGLGLVGPLHRLADWTDGCIAVTNAEMDELWRAVPDGTPIVIAP